MNAIRRMLLLLIALLPLTACGETKTPEPLLGASAAMCSPFQSPTPAPAGTAPGSCELPSPAAPAALETPEAEPAALTVAVCALD